MHSQHRSFFSIGILFLFALAMTFAGRGLAEAAVISVTPANVKAAADMANDDRAEGVAEVKTIQEILDDDATYAGAEDIINFAPGEYKDAGELLIKRAITLRKNPDADGKVMFTGKVLINIKADDVVVSGLEFMNVTVPDAVTMTVDTNTAMSGDQSVVYGFPGKTIKEMLKNDGFNVDSLELRRKGTTDLTARVAVPKNPSTNAPLFYYDWLDLKFITVVDPDDDDNDGKVANRATGTPIVGARDGNTNNASTPYAVQTSVVATSIKAALGVIWVDSTILPGATCKMSTGDSPAELPQIKGVVIRNNVFNGTDTAGVRAGDHKNLLGAVSCRVQLDIIGNTFSNIGGTGGFVKAKDQGTNLPDVTDADGNKIAELGNVAPAISVMSPAGTSDAKTRILSNTITGGLADGIELRWTPEGQKVDIKNNLLINTPLDGITVIGSSFDSTDTTTDINIMGNKIIGTSNNRYLTVPQFTLWPASHPVFYGRHFTRTLTNIFSLYSLAHGFGTSPNIMDIGACVGSAAAVDAASDKPEARRALMERIKVELWRSPIPVDYPYAVRFPRGEKFLPAYSSEVNEVPNLGVRFYLEQTNDASDSLVEGKVAGPYAVYRIAADRCFDLARIKVYNQAGVSITGNDLGYNPPDAPEKRFDVIDYGIVIEGASAMKLKAFSGNNIDFATMSSVKNGGASLSVKGNYFGPREPQFSGTIADRDEISDDPLETMAGPRDLDVNPDTAAPVLTRSGDNAPMASGTTLTLTFDENLDGDSVPAASAFRVAAPDSARTGSTRVYRVTGVAVAGMKVTLTLRETVAPGTTGLTVSYTKPGSDALADASGNELASFRGVGVNVAGGTPEPPAMPGGGSGGSAGSDDGGCALASAGSAGTDMGVMLLPLLLAGLAFVLRRRTIAD